MRSLAKLFRNFWVCIGFAVLSLFSLWSAALEESTGWIWMNVFSIVYWTHAAYRTTKSVHVDDIPLTNEQVLRINVITRRFTQEMEEVMNEAKDAKDADKKEPSDE